jgi:hypothetical protein
MATVTDKRESPDSKSYALNIHSSATHSSLTMNFTEPVEDPTKRDYAEFDKAVGAWHEYHREPAYVL